ncbi:hypothetical protein BDZ91DRAFT_473781 [Kalaharituber pfeilii]|nr:hypothetical protein BDZ91DRAFT_473781 [Kalaharituber pfeilii]
MYRRRPCNIAVHQQRHQLPYHLSNCILPLSYFVVAGFLYLRKLLCMRVQSSYISCSKRPLNSGTHNWSNLGKTIEPCYIYIKFFEVREPITIASGVSTRLESALPIFGHRCPTFISLPLTPTTLSFISFKVFV